MEVLAVTGGVASFAQIFGIVVKTGRLINELICDFDKAPEELRKIYLTLFSLKARLQSLEEFFAAFPDKFYIPPDLGLIFWVNFQEVERDVEAAARILKPYYSGGRSVRSVRSRLRYALLDQRIFDRCMKHLSTSEHSLSGIERLIELYVRTT